VEVDNLVIFHNSDAVMIDSIAHPENAHISMHVANAGGEAEQVDMSPGEIARMIATNRT
jgi:hypothetical protein